MRTLIYDGQCRLCVTAKEGLERLGPAPQQSGIRFVPYQSEEAASRLGAEYKPGRPDVAFLVEPDGTSSRGLDAFLPLVPGLPGGRVLRASLSVPRLRPLGYRTHGPLARCRSRWSGSV